MAQPQAHDATATDNLPLLEDGVFRDRGAVNTRLETFVDAAFAFTLTLLVISFDDIPTNVDELKRAMLSVPAFLASFALLMMFWFGHRSWSRRYGLDTLGASLISVALIFILLVYVYPLRAISSAALANITNFLLPTEFSMTQAGDARWLFGIYAIGFILASACIAALYAYAYKSRKRLALSDAETFLTRMEVWSWLIVGSAGVFSFALALVLPENLIGLAGWAYASLAIVMPVFGVRIGRAFEQRFGDLT